jgi:23S rRNA pseudouridine1911/1915/1917 synthase
MLTVGQSLPRERLDVFLRGQLPATSRGAIQRLLAEGRIRVDGFAVKPTHHPRAGEVITIDWPAARPDAAQPEDIPLDILYEDADLIVLNKPPGLVVHPAAGHAGHTLVNALLHHCGGQLSGIGGVARPGIVHRLDKETSGCLVAAKNDAAHVNLSAQFAGREILKVYEAIVCGRPPRAEGEIKAAIARHPTQRKRMAIVDKGGRAAHTGYRVIEQWAAAARMELRLHTGRTHQIRVHLEKLGCPVVGDATYGRRQNQRLAESTGFMAPRQMLHAAVLGFDHPRTRKPLLFKAPLPDDFTVTIKFFGIKSGREVM